jgi:cation-transporting ATPase 13A1
MFARSFACCSAGYVLKKGLEDQNRSRYQLLLRCVLIITSVVPPDLPLQMGLAVNMALMALLKNQIFCTEPFRIPLAGRLTHCLFDKTGTLTTDQLVTAGVVLPAKDKPGQAAGAAELVPAHQAGGLLAAVLGGCHALIKVRCCRGRCRRCLSRTFTLRACRWRTSSRARPRR